MKLIPLLKVYWIDTLSSSSFDLTKVSLYDSFSSSFLKASKRSRISLLFKSILFRFSWFCILYPLKHKLEISFLLLDRTASMIDDPKLKICSAVYFCLNKFLLTAFENISTVNLKLQFLWSCEHDLHSFDEQMYEELSHFFSTHIETALNPEEHWQFSSFNSQLLKKSSKLNDALRASFFSSSFFLSSSSFFLISSYLLF